VLTFVDLANLFAIRGTLPLQAHWKVTKSFKPKECPMSDTSRSSGGTNWPQQGGNKPAQNAAKGVEAIKDKVGDALDRGKSGLADSAYAAGDSLSDDVAKLRSDMAAIQKTLSKFASEAGNEAMKTAQNVGSAVASQVGDVASQVGSAASEYASQASQQVKTFASEMETMARKNPLGTIGATLLVGVVIGMMSRGRS
jgi:ElaB/YqjD/DUF883 family membrane-anchored ribosome-binding protein